MSQENTFYSNHQSFCTQGVFYFFSTGSILNGIVALTTFSNWLFFMIF